MPPSASQANRSHAATPAPSASVKLSKGIGNSTLPQGEGLAGR